MKYKLAVMCTHALTANELPTPDAVITSILRDTNVAAVTTAVPRMIPSPFHSQQLGEKGVPVVLDPLAQRVVLPERKLASSCNCAERVKCTESLLVRGPSSSSVSLAPSPPSSGSEDSSYRGGDSSHSCHTSGSSTVVTSALFFGDAGTATTLVVWRNLPLAVETVVSSIIVARRERDADVAVVSGGASSSGMS